MTSPFNTPPPSPQSIAIDPIPDLDSGTVQDAIEEVLEITSTGGLGISFDDIDKPKAGGVYSFMMPYAMAVRANCAGSSFYNKTNPSAQVVIAIHKNGVEFATCTVSTSGVGVFVSSATNLAEGDRISFVFPASQDSTWAGVAITLKGKKLKS